MPLNLIDEEERVALAHVIQAQVDYAVGCSGAYERYCWWYDELQRVRAWKTRNR